MKKICNIKEGDEIYEINDDQIHPTCKIVSLSWEKIDDSFYKLKIFGEMDPIEALHYETILTLDQYTNLEMIEADSNYTTDPVILCFDDYNEEIINNPGLLENTILYQQLSMLRRNILRHAAKRIWDKLGTIKIKR